MSDIGKIKAPIQPNPVRAVNKEPAKKKQAKKKKDKSLPEQEGSEVHVNEVV